ncbi:50s ribosomal protein l21, partial [Globisporangium splendens]
MLLRNTTQACQLATRPVTVLSAARSAMAFSTQIPKNTTDEPPRGPLPPFTRESAALKVRAAEDAWNSRDPHKVAQAYTVDSQWRNRSEFIRGRQEIEAFLTRKWSGEGEYRLIKELFAFDGNRIAVRFAYEWFSVSEKQWYRAYGNENWEFDDKGYMAKRFASINDVAIGEHERKYHWPQGRRPDDHPSLSDLGH